MGRPNSAAIIALVVAPALLLAITAAASSIAAFHELPHRATMERINSGEPVTPRAASAAVEANLAAAAWFEAPRYRTAAAVALIARGEPGDLAAAESLTRVALAGAPAAPRGWARLSYTRRAAGDLSGARQAWLTSVLTGRYVPALMAARTSLGVSLLPLGDPGFEREVVNQILVHARTRPEDLARIARDTNMVPVVILALVSDPEALRSFNAQSAYLTQQQGRTLVQAGQ